MIRRILVTGLAAAIVLAPAASIAQQPAPGDSVETYSDTLPRHHSSVKRQIALKTSSKKTGSKSHKTRVSHKSGKGRHGKKGTA